MDAMLPPLIPLRETHMIGPECREWVLGRERFRELATGGFAWVGHSALRPPYRMVRMSSVYPHVAFTFGGRGRILVGGDVRDWLPGEVMLCPRGAQHAFEAAYDEPWLLAWVFYDDSHEAPLLPGTETRLLPADGANFVATLQMMTREAAAGAEAAAMQALVALLHIHTLRLCGEKRADARLARLWEAVEADLGRNWDNAALARRAGISEEHLRRLSRQGYGESPMRHLATLRMHRACVLLRRGESTIADVADQLGFSSVYSFSAAFRKWSGVPPGAFREGAGRSTLRP